MIRLFTHCKWLFLVSLVLSLCGCGHSQKEKEVREYVAKIKSRQIKEIEALPEISPYEPFAYTASNLRSPFLPSKPQEVARPARIDNGISPDIHRRKEALESFPIDSLRMVGTIDKDQKKWALVADPKGSVYRLSKGNYVGQNHGRIQSITDDKIEIVEVIPATDGGWQERKATMSLATDKPRAGQ